MDTDTSRTYSQKSHGILQWSVKHEEQILVVDGNSDWCERHLRRRFTSGLLDLFHVQDRFA